MEIQTDKISLDQVLEQAERISDKCKPELISGLLANSGLSVIFVIMQINVMGSDELSQILHAVAERIATVGNE